MPTQHDFRAAATALRTLATTAGASANAVNDAHVDVGMRGGNATAVVDAAMNASFLNARAVESASGFAADEFDRRARVCADYTDDMQRWRDDMDIWRRAWSSHLAASADDPDAIGPGSQPGRPTRWPLWVEEG